MDKSKKFIVLSDMDSTIENLTEVWIKFLNVLHMEKPDYNPVSYTDLDRWNLEEFFPMLTHEELFAPLKMDCIWSMVKPLQGSIQALKAINEDPRFELYLCTAAHTTQPRVEFIKKYFPFISYKEQVISAYKKQLVRGDVLIDDYENNLIGGSYQGILYSQPWNQSFDAESHGIIRVNNWDEAVNQINLLQMASQEEQI